MARLSHDGDATADVITPHDQQLLDLSQLLNRLRQNVLHPTPEREQRLRTSELERVRVGTNVQYARTLLERVEQDEKTTALRTAVLDAHRETLESLEDRMEDFKKIAVDENQESSDEEDLLGDVVPTPSDSVESPSAEARQQEAETETDKPDKEPVPTPDPSSCPPPTATAMVKPDSPAPAFATQTAQTLRPRHTTTTAPSSTTDAASADTASISSGTSSHSKARAALFASRRAPTSLLSSSSTAPPQVSSATAEALLDQQRAEQDALSESMLRMASALKASSQRFSTTLETDRDVLGRAGEGIERTERGMEAARGRMGVLKRMTEGKGWWGRMVLYAWVYGLMVALVLLVFALPKLRF